MGEPVGIVIIMVGGSHGGNMQQGKADTADSPDRPDKIDKTDVLEKLRTVQDPHLRRDIVSLGFVKNVRICSPIISFDIERSYIYAPEGEARICRMDQITDGNPIGWTIRTFSGALANSLRAWMSGRPTGCPGTSRTSRPCGWIKISAPGSA